MAEKDRVKQLTGVAGYVQRLLKFKKILVEEKRELEEDKKSVVRLLGEVEEKLAKLKEKQKT